MVQELVEHLARPLHPPDVPLQVQPVQARYEIANVKNAIQREQLVHYLPEFGGRRLPLDVLLAEHHARDHAERHHLQVATEPHDAPGRRRLSQAAEHPARLLVADVLERVEPPGAEELRGADSARLAQVRPVLGPHDVGGVVRGVPADRERRAAGERRVVGLEEEPGHLGGRADDDGHLPEPEVHERAVQLGELVDGAVRQLTQEVEVADNRPRLGARREVVGAAAPAGSHGLEEEHGDEHDGEERRPWWERHACIWVRQLSDGWVDLGSLKECKTSP